MIITPEQIGAYAEAVAGVITVVGGAWIALMQKVNADRLKTRLDQLQIQAAINHADTKESVAAVHTLVVEQGQPPQTTQTKGN